MKKPATFLETCSFMSLCLIFTADMSATMIINKRKNNQAQRVRAECPYMLPVFKHVDLHLDRKPVIMPKVLC